MIKDYNTYDFIQSTQQLTEKVDIRYHCSHLKQSWVSPEVVSETRIQVQVKEWGNEPRKESKPINLALWKRSQLCTTGAQSPWRTWDTEQNSSHSPTKGKGPVVFIYQFLSVTQRLLWGSDDSNHTCAWATWLSRPRQLEAAEKVLAVGS